MTNNTDPVRALIGEMTEYLDQVVDPELDVIERWRDRLESALASAPTSAPVGVDAKARRLYEMIFDAIAEDGSQQAEDACIREIASALAQQPAAVDEDAAEALRFLLTRIGSWTNARWDQHLRHEFGDDRAGRMIAALAAQQQGGA